MKITSVDIEINIRGEDDDGTPVHVAMHPALEGEGIKKLVIQGYTAEEFASIATTGKGNIPSDQFDLRIVK